MAQNSQTTIVFTTLLIERSPQALPLGAACVASATKSNPSIKEYVNVELMDFCMEDSSIELLLKTKGLDSVSDYISEKILKRELQDGQNVQIDVKDNEFIFSIN